MESKNNIVEGNNNELNKAGYIIALVTVFFYIYNKLQKTSYDNFKF